MSSISISTGSVSDEAGTPKSESDEDERDSNLDTLKEGLLACLDAVDAGGSFSAHFSSSTFVNPGLAVQGRPIGLPLSPNDGEALAKLGRQAPFGNKEQTVIDTSVRRTWELDTSEFRLENPAWNGYLESLVIKAVQELGVEGPVRAEPYKLLLYEQGAFFKPHKDTEKVPGMFGTLVICLPAHHEGGDVCLSHAGRKRVLRTSPSSRFDISVLAWYGDVTHEVKPLTAGYRLVLTYNLVHGISQLKPSAGRLEQGRRHFHNLLRKWQADCSYEETLLFILEHKYTINSLRMDALKGRDAALGRHLNDVCARSGVFFLLAQMTYVNREEDEYYDDEVEDGDVLLSHIVTPCGGEIIPSMSVSANSILTEDPFGREADSVAEGEFTGNEGMPSTYTYRDTVVLLVPKSKLADIFQRHFPTDPTSMSEILDLYASDIRAYPSDHPTVSAAMRILGVGLTYATAETALPDGENKILDSISNLCKALDRPDLTCHAIHALLPKCALSDGILLLFVKELEKTDGNDATDALLEKIFSLPEKSFDITNLGNISKNFISIERLLPETLVAAFKRWSTPKLDRAMSMVNQVDEKDVDAVMQLVTATTPEAYFQKILPIVVKHASRAAFVAFLARLYDFKSHANASSIIAPTYAEIFGQKAHCLVPTAKDFKSDHARRLQQTRTAAVLGYHQWLYPIHSGVNPEKMDPRSYPNQFMEMLDASWSLGMRHEVLGLVEALSFPANDDCFREEWKSVTQFLIQLTAFVKARHDPSLTSSATPKLEMILGNLLAGARHKLPQPPNGWARNPSKCGCQDCHTLNAFLRNPRLQSERFAMAEKRRRHLEYSLDRRDYEFATECYKTPYTLVITKKNSAYTRELAAWRLEVGERRQSLKPLCGDFMRAVTGERYEELVLMNLDAPSATPSTQTHQNGGPSNVYLVPPVAGVKRRAGDIED